MRATGKRIISIFICLMLLFSCTTVLGRENLKQKPQPMPRQFSWKSYLPAVWFLEAQLLLREQLQ